MRERLVEGHFKTTHSMVPGSFEEDFLRVLCAFEDGKWIPERFNSYEPTRKIFRQDQIPTVVDQWLRDGIGIILKRVSSPKYDISFSGIRENLLVKCEMTMWINETAFTRRSEIESFLALATRFYEVLRPSHGFVAHRADYLMKNHLKYVDTDGETTVEEWVGRDLHENISGIYWANWFGPVYTDFFGRENIESAPCYRMDRLADGGHLLLTAASPLEYDRPETKEIEKKVREHLGPDRFYDIQHPNRATISPWSSKFVS